MRAGEVPSWARRGRRSRSDGSSLRIAWRENRRWPPTVTKLATPPRPAQRRTASGATPGSRPASPSVSQSVSSPVAAGDCGPCEPGGRSSPKLIKTGQIYHSLPLLSVRVAREPLSLLRKDPLPTVPRKGGSQAPPPLTSPREANSTFKRPLRVARYSLCQPEHCPCSVRVPE